MKKALLLMVLTAFLPLYGQLVLSHGGKTDYTIVYDLNIEDVVVNPAVEDLSLFLEKITGAKFPIAAKADGPKIMIGVTAPGDTRAFQPRERRIRSVGKDIYIYGDYRYGTVGAIYNFLTQFCGCRWYTATGDMRIPKNAELTFKSFDYSHVPSFKSIEHGSKQLGAIVNPDIRAWVRRNNSFLMPKYHIGEPDDAWRYIGPVTHTLFAYFPPIRRRLTRSARRIRA